MGGLRGASVVRPAGALTGGECVDWRVRGRKWYTVLSGQACPLPRLLMWRVGHVLFISVSGTVVEPILRILESDWLVYT